MMEAVYSRELGILSNMQNRIDSSVYLNIRGTPANFFLHVLDIQFLWFIYFLKVNFIIFFLYQII